MQAIRVTNHIYFGDCIAFHPKAHNRKYFAVRKPRHNPGGAVDEHWLNSLGEMREHERTFGRNARAPNLTHCTVIAPHYYIGVEHRNERVKIAVSNSSEKGIHNSSLLF